MRKWIQNILYKTESLVKNLAERTTKAARSDQIIPSNGKSRLENITDGLETDTDER